MGKKNVATENDTVSEGSDKATKAYKPRHNVATDGMRPDTIAELSRYATDFAMLSLTDEKFTPLAKSLIEIVKALKG